MSWDVVLLCCQLLPGEALLRQLHIVAPQGDLLLLHTPPLSVTLSAVDVPVRVKVPLKPLEVHLSLTHRGSSQTFTSLSIMDNGVGPKFEHNPF